MTIKHPWKTARFYVDDKGRECCELTSSNGYVHPRSFLRPGEFEAVAKPWCERTGVEIVDERHVTHQSRERIDNEAELYRIKRP
jgi:hypothetical protein